MKIIVDVHKQLILKNATPTMAADFFQVIDHNRTYLAQYLSWVNHINSIEDDNSFYVP